MPDTIPEILIPADEIQEKVCQLGARISSDFRSEVAVCPEGGTAQDDRRADETQRTLILTGVLKGALFFLADLAREISVPVEIEYMSVSSYGKSTRSSGVVRILKDLDRDIAGADVLLVEDIVDTGLTLDYLLRILEPRRPPEPESLQPAGKTRPSNGGSANRLCRLLHPGRVCRRIWT